jgi:hypothetical protein
MTLGVSLGDGNALASGDRTYAFDADYRPFSFSAAGKFSGPLVFAGFGIAAADDHKYDDYAGLDVRGKVVLAMRFEPHNADGKSRFGTDSYTDHATFRRKAEVAAERGAAALLVVTPPTYHADDGLVPFVDGFVGGSAEIPVVQVTQAVANDLLARAGAPDLKTLQARIDETGRSDSRPLDGVTVSGTVDVKPTTTTVKNVAAVLHGSGPRADEYVVVGAHYDHLGRRGQMGPPEQRRDIHNGADDNASGTAAMLELAERFARSGPHERSLVFVAFTAEEQGLIGSQRFVKHPPVPLDRVVAMVNLDMVGRVRQATLYVGGAGTAAGLQDVLNRADAASQLDLKDIGKGGLGPSDHMSFAVKRIPVLFFFTGLHAEYHRPADDADLINYAGLRAVVDLTEAVVGDIIDMPRQEYVAASDASSAFRVGSPGSTMKVTLGVVPNYGAGEPGGAGSGVLIDGTVPGSPAAEAGLRAGDVITSLGEKRIRDIYDLTTALGDRKPGDRVAVQVRRDGQDVTLGATLVARGAMSPSTASPHGPDPHAAPGATQPTTTEATKKG